MRPGSASTIGWLAVALVGLTFAAPASGAEPRVVNFGVVVDGPWERNEAIFSQFRKEISDLLEPEFGVRFPPELYLTADFTLGRARETVDRLLADPRADLVIAAGPLASLDAARRDKLPKPVIAVFVMDSHVQGIPRQGGTSGVHNLCYLECPNSIEKELRAFLEIVPFHKLVFLGNPGFLREIPELGIAAAAETLGIEFEMIPASGRAEDALAAIPEGTEAVYMTPLLELDPGEFDHLIAGLNARKLPTFSYLGRSDVERGVLAGLATDTWFDRLARRTAVDIQRILLGENAGDLPVAVARREELVINMATAREIGVYPSFQVLTEAVLLHPARSEVERKLDLDHAVEEAVAVNLDLAVAEQDVVTGRQEISLARSSLLPRVDLQGLGTMIDKDRAKSSFGSVAERTLAGTATLTQVLWSEPTWANLSIQRSLQRSRESERDRIRLDLVRQAASAYLDVLRTKTFERIQTENLKLTRSNLELAQIREDVGVSGPAEVYRWESEIASQRKAVIEANSRRNLAEIALNRLLHRPLEDPFLTEEAGLDDPALPTSDPRFARYFGDPWTFRIFRRFMVEEGIAASPEIQQIDASIAAQERTRDSARRSFFSPTIALQGSVTRTLAEGGAGSDPVATGPLAGLVEGADDTDWGLGLSVSLPLFTGGSRIAEARRAGGELERLRLERRALAERVEQRIRIALHLAGASFAGIALANDSAEAARQNLDLVTDAYSQGAVRIIDLLDAQNAALNAEQAAANAVHDFLIDLMELERSTGRFSFFSSPEERKAWFDRAEAYLENATRP